jgi:transposase-like protein
MMPNNPNKSHPPTPGQMPSKKVYTREFKLETLRLLKSSGKTKAELERELGLYQGQLSLWEKAFNREGVRWNRPFQAQAIKATQKLN